MERVAPGDVSGKDLEGTSTPRPLRNLSVSRTPGIPVSPKTRTRCHPVDEARTGGFSPGPDRKHHRSARFGPVAFCLGRSGEVATRRREGVDSETCRASVVPSLGAARPRSLSPVGRLERLYPPRKTRAGYPDEALHRRSPRVTEPCAPGAPVDRNGPSGGTGNGPLGGDKWHPASPRGPSDMSAWVVPEGVAPVG